VIGIANDEIAALVSAVDYTDALTIAAGEKEVGAACAVAKRFGCRAVVAFPQYIAVIVEELRGTSVLAQIPVGYPCGGHTTKVKCYEAEEGLRRGATDLDMVMNISAFKAGDRRKAAEDISAVRAVAEPYGVPFKVIIESGALTDEEIVDASRLVMDCGADFVKTCTGFGPGRLTLHAVRLIKETVGDRIGIKASGGVPSIEDGVAFMRAGATVVTQRRSMVQQLEAIGWGSTQ
jgi:deoxyribose-phosphate aldolase